MEEIIEDVLARRDVDLDVAPFLGRDLGEAPLHQRFAGRDDLNDGGVTGLEIALDRADQGRRLHRRDEMREEPLLRGLEGGSGGGLRLGVERAALAGDVGGTHGSVEVVVDDLERAGVGVVDADLLRCQLVLDELVFDALVGERTRGVEAERLEIACEHFHGGDTAGFDRLHELAARGEREVLAAPQAETLRIGEIVHRGRAGGRHVHDAGVGQARVAGAIPRAPAVMAPDRRARPWCRRRSPSHGFRRTR